MTGYFDRLNLRPAERRLVVLVAVVLFVVANLIFVWPYFGSWNLANLRLLKAEDKLRSFQREIGQTNSYLGRLAEFEKENPEVPTEDQSLQFQRIIQTQAAQSGVNVNNFGRASTRTNDPFFLEQLQTISVLSREKELVEFLHQLGDGTSLIRVRELSLRPDQNRFNLQGNITLVASYQKKAPVRGSPSARPGGAAAPARPTAGTPAPAPSGGSRPAAPGATTTKITKATNAPAKAGVWQTVKGWFGGGDAPAVKPGTTKTNLPATGAPRTNALPPAPKPNPVRPTSTNAPAKPAAVPKP
jgi:hypothetical protein